MSTPSGTSRWYGLVGLKSIMTYDFKFGHRVPAIYLGKVIKFQNFITSITEDMNCLSVPARGQK